MQLNNFLNKFRSNNTHNASFAHDTAADTNQQQPGANPQAAPVQPLANAGDLSANPAARNLQEYQAQAIRTGALAIGKAKEAFELVKSAKIPEKIEAFYSQIAKK